MANDTSPIHRTKKIRPDHYDRIRANTHILYRCYNRRSLLMYVGMTNDPEQRFKQHAKDKPWWKYVDHIRLQSFKSRKLLAEAEAAAIQHEQPKFNVVVPGGAPVLNKDRKSTVLWSEPSTFGTVVPEYGYLINQTLEQQLFPCVECHARSIYCEGDTVSCGLCSSTWSFEQWFSMTFNTPESGQMTLM